jgi:hypothetical protein|tara:strand:+ start:475 stop:816 length:342 start_codon:yes stop_codon:yes gene_type:complete
MKNIASKILAFFSTLLTRTRKPEPENKMNQELKNFIAETKGRFFSIEYKTKDGKVRVANGKDFYRRLTVGGKNHVEGAGFTAFVNRNTESWNCAKGENVLTFKCGEIRKKVKV